MATAAEARRALATPRVREDRDVPPVRRGASQSRQRTAEHSRLSRTVMVFIVCLTVLAAGRVALSCAVVQKTLQTDAITRQARQVSAENAHLAVNLAQLSSPAHIRWVAERELGFVEVDPDNVHYLRAPRADAVAQRGSSD